MTREAGAVAGGAPVDVERLFGLMTLEEKAALIVGRDNNTTEPIARLGIPSIWFADGPTGVRKLRDSARMLSRLGDEWPATCFPTESALGASWDTALVKDVGRAIALEAQALGVQVLCGPGVNLKRSPLCGRNFEYFSEDPVLSGELAAAFVMGVQEQGVAACIKHLVANETETDRMLSDSEVDERTLREVYLRPFEIAMAKASPWCVMSAYNRLNGTLCSEHPHLLREILSQEWGYDGIVVSDWYAVTDRVAAIEAGLHLQMPAAQGVPAIIAAVRKGRLDERRLDEIVRALLAFILKVHAARKSDVAIDWAEHHSLARRAAGQAIVLLKNEGRLLPLEGDDLTDLALIGWFAKSPPYEGGGSSCVVPAQAVETLHDALVSLIGSAGQVTYAAGYDPDNAATPALLAEAQAVAGRAKVAVVVVGLPPSSEAEGADRQHLNLPPGHNALIEAVQVVQPRTAVVLLNGAPVALPWVTRIPAIVEGWLGGQGSGGAIADVLLGRVNPSGKLAETFPVRLEDTPGHLSFPNDGTGRVPFAEGVFVGYRWYEARRIKPLFPFGHGLSYTSFAYEDLSVDNTAVTAADASCTVSLRVRNTGTRAGHEVLQLYVRERQPRLRRPEKELRAFAKVGLGPGEETTVSFRLTLRDFAVYDPQAGGWTTGVGDYDLLVGASSDDIRLQECVRMEAAHGPAPRLDRMSPLREWLRHPLVHARLQPILADLGRQWTGETGGAAGGSEEGAAEAILRDMPIGKLMYLGALDEDDIAQLADAVNGH
jgi:beta-glucosidase